MTTLSKVIIMRKRTWAMQKNKRHAQESVMKMKEKELDTWRSKSLQKKRKEEKASPCPRKRIMERDDSRKGVHTSSTKNIHRYAHLDQDL
jgi:hypothetical protein